MNITFSVSEGAPASSAQLTLLCAPSRRLCRRREPGRRRAVVERAGGELGGGCGEARRRALLGRSAASSDSNGASRADREAQSKAAFLGRGADSPDVP